MSLQAIDACYRKCLVDADEAHEDWATNVEWTTRAVRALVKVGRSRFPHKRVQVAAKGGADDHGQSEYLTLDVCLWDADNKWGPPLFIAEHESKRSALEVRYSAWKLLVVQASVRVLVTYFGKETPFATAQELQAAVQQVCQANPGRELILLCADTEDANSNSAVIARHLPAIQLVG